MKFAPLILFALVAFTAVPGVYADSASLNVSPSDLTQIVAPSSPATSPVSSTTAQAANSVAIETITDLAAPAPATTDTTLDVVDMSSSYLSLAPITHVSSYTYEPHTLNADLTARLYKLAAITFGAGLVLALGLIEAAQNIDLARLASSFRNEEVI